MWHYYSCRVKWLNLLNKLWGIFTHNIGEFLRIGNYFLDISKTAYIMVIILTLNARINNFLSVGRGAQMRNAAAKRASKLRNRRVSISIPTFSILRDIETDQAEISLFLSLSRFRAMIQDIKRSLYRRPQHVWRESR
jgi:hypothetical protein